MEVRLRITNRRRSPARRRRSPVPRPLPRRTSWTQQAADVRLPCLVCMLALGVVLQCPPAFATTSNGAAALPDGRAWEMVSPPLKSGSLIEAISNEGGVIQASEDGSAIAYVANAPIVSTPTTNPEGNRSKEPTQLVSVRGSAGWSTTDLATPNDAATGLIPGNGSEYRFFSSDLSVGLVEPESEQPLSPEASEKTIYLREHVREPEAPVSYMPLVTAANATGQFGRSFRNDVHILDAAPNLSHVVFSSTEALTPGSVQNEGARNLYEWAGGHLRLVSSFGGGASAGSPELGDHGQDVRGAVSDDGTRIVWSNGEGQNEQHLYMRDTATGETVQLDAAQGVAEPSGAGHRALPDGQQRRLARVLHRPAAPDRRLDRRTALRTSPTSTSAKCSKKRQARLPPAATSDAQRGEGEHANVQGLLLGTSEDGTTTYFVAHRACSPKTKTATAKAPSPARTTSTESPLRRHRVDAPPSSRRSPAKTAPSGKATAVSNTAFLTARVSPNGRYLAFMSAASLTGYDNVDVHSGVPDEEVYLYDRPTPA